MAMGFLFGNKKKEVVPRQLFGESITNSMTEPDSDMQEELNDTVAASEAVQPNDSMSQSEASQLRDSVTQSEETQPRDSMTQSDIEQPNDTMSRNNATQPRDNMTESNTEQSRDTMTQINNQEELLNRVLDYFIANEGKLLSKMQSCSGEQKEQLGNEIIRKAEEQFKLNGLRGKEKEDMIDRFRRYMWGYYVLDPLIEDKSVFDIKCYSDSHIRVKRMGNRMDAPEEIRFASPEDYKRFVRAAATKNKINLSMINAIATFTDKDSSPDFILRFDISTEVINTSRLPCLHIRKLPKTKYTLEELIELGFLTKDQADYFRERAANSGGILFTGAGGSGKTCFMNTLLEVYPHDKSGLVIQENEELFSETHPDMNFQHVLRTNGEGKITYELEDLARQGLLNDIDLFVVGEIKGKEAGSFAMCSYTGAQAWCSCHGKNEMEAVYKLADYVKSATGYTLDESLKMLSGLEVVCYIKNFHLEGVSEIKGWDYENNRLVIEKKYFPDSDGYLCDTVTRSNMTQLSDSMTQSDRSEETRELEDISQFIL